MLPHAAASDYAEALGVMKLIPWNDMPINGTKPDAQVRQLVFGPGGKGLVTYLIPKDQQWVGVLTMTRMG